MTRTLLIVTALASALLSGCASQGGRYHWGDYEQSLYSYYKAPTDLNGFALSLEDSIKQGETLGKRIAPGLYAELGYLLMLQGKKEQAIVLFEKERSLWPQSTQLMTTMIRLASEAPKGEPSQALVPAATVAEAENNAKK